MRVQEAAQTTWGFSFHYHSRFSGPRSGLDLRFRPGLNEGMKIFSSNALLSPHLALCHKAGSSQLGAQTSVGGTSKNRNTALTLCAPFNPSADWSICILKCFLLPWIFIINIKYSHVNAHSPSL